MRAIAVPEEDRMVGEFDFCQAMRSLCHDICERHIEFRHIDMRQILVSITQTRSPSVAGRQAKLTPLRFARGRRVESRSDGLWAVQRLWHEGVEMRYLLTFYLPRFLDQTYTEKLVTIFHELYHIDPEFTGDVRRFPGACYLHSESHADYDLRMAAYVRQYLRMKPDPDLRSFLKSGFRALERRRGRIIGLKVPLPRVFRIREDVAA